MKTRTNFLRFTLFLLILLCLAFLALPFTEARAEKYGGVLKIGIKWDSRKILDPHTQRGYLVILATQQMFNYLVRERLDGTIEPRLATSWEASDGGKVWTFHLRQGVKFHDGSDWDAQAFKWNLDRLMDRKVGSYFRSFRLTIDKIEILDKYTCQITLKRPYYFIASFLGGMFKPKFISPAIVEKYGKEWVKHAAGTGPFMFDHMDEDGTTYLKRNPNYWEKGLPYLDEVIFKMYRDPRARNNAICAGEIDMEMGASFEHYLISKQDPNLVVAMAPALSYALNLGANVTIPPWNDVRVRRAIMGYALDRDKICKTVYHGLTKPKINPSSAAHYYYEDLNYLYPFDLAKTKKLLKEAGVIGQTLTLTVNNTSTTYDAIGIILKADLAKIGVNIKIEKMEYVTWIRRFYVAHKIALSMPYSYFNDPSSWGAYIGPAAARNPTQAGIWLDKEKKVNQDPKLVQLLDDAAATMKDPERKIAYQKLFRHMAEQAYMVGVATPTGFHNFRKHVKGYKWRLLNSVVDTVYLEK